MDIKINQTTNKSHFIFDTHAFNYETGELISGENKQRLEPTISKLLHFFIINRDKLVSRDELIKNV